MASAASKRPQRPPNGLSGLQMASAASKRPQMTSEVKGSLKWPQWVSFNDLSMIHCFKWSKMVIFLTSSPQEEEEQQQQQLLGDIDLRWRCR